MSDLQARIEALWADRTPITEGDAEARAAVTEAIGLLDAGEARVAEVNGAGEVVVNQWLKQAILLLFSMAEMETMELGPFEYADKIPLKTDYQAAGVRVDDMVGIPSGLELDPAGTAVTVLDREGGRHVLILLGDTPATLHRAVTSLLSGGFRADLVSEVTGVSTSAGASK